MADCCEQCAHYITDDEFGDYCGVNLDEDEMERFLTQSVKSCHSTKTKLKTQTPARPWAGVIFLCQKE